MPAQASSFIKYITPKSRIIRFYFFKNVCQRISSGRCVFQLWKKSFQRIGKLYCRHRKLSYRIILLKISGKLFQLSFEPRNHRDAKKHGVVAVNLCVLFVSVVLFFEPRSYGDTKKHGVISSECSTIRGSNCTIKPNYRRNFFLHADFYSLY